MRPREAKLAALRTAIERGDASGVGKGDAFASARKAMKLSKKSAAIMRDALPQRAT